MTQKSCALCACSDAFGDGRRQEIASLCETLENMGLSVRNSPYIFSENAPFSVGGREKAEWLNTLFRDENITEIFDVSGGDLASEVVPYLDYRLAAVSHARFWGYSDLTCVLNALYAAAGKTSVLYQARKILVNRADEFENAVYNRSDELFEPPFEFLRGNKMSGTVVGGNIRCFLKLAGTEYFPDLDGKLLLLESLGGGTARIAAYLTHLEMLGAFAKVNGVLLGTFTELDRELGRKESLRFILSRIPKGCAVAKTDFVGHGGDSRAVVIGGSMTL